MKHLFYSCLVVTIILTGCITAPVSIHAVDPTIQKDQRPECLSFNHASKEGNKHYKLSMNGYAEEVSVTQAVEDFNRYAQCHQLGKTQPPLTVDEFLAAVRDANPAEEKIQDWVYKIYRQISKTQMMPKGAFIDYGLGAVNDRGYDIQLWSIDLYVGLDKYSRERKGNPFFRHTVRRQYISSEPTKHKART
jgi:hypothetical protein